ncbi:MAG: alpha/beta fold hydrolase [Prochloraceae cyanobacterium]|nr:alpha/beta fold hydrolase [Prochloraceae cyanobacterium]
MQLVFKNQTFSFELLRTLGYAPYCGADIGECLKTAYGIKSGDFESWYEEWIKTARRVHALADDALAHRQRVSAREAYLRASNYYRTAEFFLHGQPTEPRILEAWSLSRTTFREAIQLMDTPVEPVQIPYEKTALPGYFYRPDDSEKPRPTLIVHGGYDSTGEELYFQVAAAARERQYNCLTFEGPGQGTLIREQQLPFRPDWEKVVTPVVDYLLTRSEVEPARLALMGISLGGYLAPRAAAFEHRLAALIANDGMYTYRFSEKARAITQVAALFGRGVAEYTLKKVMQHKPSIRWAIENGLFTFQVGSIWDLIAATESWSLEGVANQIACPTLVCEAEGDHFFAGQAKMLYEALTCLKTFMRFTASDGAEAHCQFGALLLFNHRVFEWLDATLGIRRE